MEFCPGCGRKSLRKYSDIHPLLGEGRESPCTAYVGLSRGNLIREMRHLEPDELNQVLEHYGYEKVE